MSCTLIDSGKNWQVIKPERTDKSFLWDEFVTTDFQGGTLVEYKDGYGFTREWGRGEIVLFTFNSELGLKIITDAEAFWTRTPFAIAKYPASVSTRHGVYYLDVPDMWCYAVAPKGIEIPKP